MTKQDDGLFLLEVLVDKIVFLKSPCFSDKEFRTCVNIECASIEPLLICDDDPGACTSKSMGPFVKNFNSGKSCLFSLKESEISSAMSKFPIKISVFKSLPCGCLPTKIIMGEATIDMTKEFIEARKKFLSDPDVVSYQALRDSFRIFGPDDTETGEIVMFLRISCFGKLIITRFQGGGGPPALSAGGNNAIVDRSCNPQKEFQSAQDPCACGAARGVGGGAGAHGAAGGRGGATCTMGGGAGGGAGVCPPARDPYNIMPCQDPDDPCYCTGPKPPPKDQMACRNTDQYCLHIPKGELPNLPYSQDLSEEQKLIIMATIQKDGMMGEKSLLDLNDYYDERRHIIEESADYMRPSESFMSFGKYSTFSLSNVKSNVSFLDIEDYVSLYHSIVNDAEKSAVNNVKFGPKEISVYMTLFDELMHNRRSTTGTQATASINKCFQVYNKNNKINLPFSSPNNYSSCTMTTATDCETKKIDRVRYSDVYFFERKKDSSGPNKMEMGKKEKHQRIENRNSRTVQTYQVAEISTGTSTKTVSIKDDKTSENIACPAFGQSAKGEMVATVSHIKVGPREPCPVHCKEPCQGPKCIVASSGEEKAPVKVTTVSNPRRGVFELVIRRLNGAPLAKNELMLEWTPPPYQPSCGQPCALPCPAATPPCHPSKCKMIICRPSYKPKGCRKPCGPPCRSVPCSFCCKKICGKPCKPCKPRRPCPLPRCKPCSPCRPCKPCRPCPPPRKIFKRPCPSPCCKPCGRCSACTPCGPPPPCRPCGPPPPCRPCGPPSPYRPCGPSPTCRLCGPPPPCRLCGPLPPCRPPLPCRSCRRCKPRSPVRCKSCKRCRACPRSPCRPCPPSPCLPCPPSPCSPCPPSPCRPFPPPPCRPCRPCSPCPPCPTLCSPPPDCSSPCRMICCRKTRKCKSHPRIRSHPKRISPCLNRSKCCPVVRCRSFPGPCIDYCSTLPCPPRICYPVPCKPPKCKSSCSTCCT